MLDVDTCPIFKVGLVRFAKQWIKGFLKLNGAVQTRYSESNAELESLKWVFQPSSFFKIVRAESIPICQALD